MSRQHVIQWIKTIVVYRSQHPEQRQGQVAFNTIADLHPKLAREIKGNELDPFYSDAALEKFIPWVTTQLLAMHTHQTTWRNK